MKLFDVEAVSEAQKKMEELKKSISPLAAVLLLADYSHPELEKAISKLHSNHIDRINIRFNVVFQLLQNQKNEFNRQKDGMNTPIQSMYDKTYCDFKDVMEILGTSRGVTETLISKGDINPVNHKTGKKRLFKKSEIIEYARGL